MKHIIVFLMYSVDYFFLTIWKNNSHLNVINI